MGLREIYQCATRDQTTPFIVGSLFVLLGAFCFGEVPPALRWPARILWFAALLWLALACIRVAPRLRFTVKKAVFSLIMAGIVYLALALLCQVFVLIMSKRDDRMVLRGTTKLTADTRADLLRMARGLGINAHDPKVGWVPRPGMEHEVYHTNTQGIRTLHDYPVKAADETKRYLCMGDSFTFGVAVKNDETYPAQAEKQMPGSEWLNFGIPGGCLTQAYVHYQEHAKAFGGKHVVIGFMTNDAQRTVNCFRPFLNADSGSPATKPFAKYVNGAFTIEPNVCQTIAQLRNLYDHEAEELPKLLKIDYLTWSGRQGKGGAITRAFTYVYKAQRLDQNLDALFNNKIPVGTWAGSFLPRDPYGDDIWEKDSPGFQAICILMSTFVKQVIADGRQPLIVIIPGPHDVDDRAKNHPRVYANLLDYLKSHQLPHFDFLDPLVAKHRHELNEKALFVGKHYKPTINGELATEIIRALATEAPRSPK